MKSGPTAESNSGMGIRASNEVVTKRHGANSLDTKDVKLTAYAAHPTRRSLTGLGGAPYLTTA